MSKLSQNLKVSFENGIYRLETIQMRDAEMALQFISPASGTLDVLVSTDNQKFSKLVTGFSFSSGECFLPITGGCSGLYVIVEFSKEVTNLVALI